MKPVQKVAANREQSAVQKLGQSQQYLEAQQARLEELRAYRDQYARSFETSGSQGLGVTRIQEYRVFLGRLNEAVQQQEDLISQYLAQHEQTRQHWIETRSHSQAIDKVVDRYRRDEKQQQAKQEQQELDERAQRTRPK